MNDRFDKHGMSLIVKTVTHLLAAFILLFGVYIVLYGHLTPGGGFAGGVITACAFILLTLAEGRAAARQTVSNAVSSALDCVGALLFLGMALAGLYLSREHVFFKNFIETGRTAWFRLWSSGIILICNLGIGLKVGMSLVLVFSVLATIRVAMHGESRRVFRKGREE